MVLYRLSAVAKEDIVQILAYTEVNFGEIARIRYQRLLMIALRDIVADPQRAGSIARASWETRSAATTCAIVGTARGPNMALCYDRAISCSIG